MKLEFLAPLREKMAEHKLLTRLIGILLVIAIGAGAWFGWKEYQYRQSAQYAFEKLREAISPPNPHALASLVDFNSLSADLADASRKSFPFFLSGPDQERNIRHILQSALLKKFISGDSSSKKKNTEETEEELLHQPLALLPPDFAEQIAKTLNLRETDGNTAYVNARVANPLLNRNFTFVMRMDRTRSGWKLTHMANAQELGSALRAAMLERHAKLRNVYLDKNAATTKKMDQLLPIQSCSADAGLLSDKKTLLLVVNVLARNKGAHQVNNFNVDTVIKDGKGRVVLRRFLNAAKPVAPGEDFDHRWTFELDAKTEPGRDILHAGPLHCEAAWQTLGVGSGEVLHVVEVPNPDVKCQIAGHDHPQGFCQIPVFSR